MEEKEESEIFYLKTLLVSVVHLDYYDSGGRRDKGALSLGEELWKRGIGYLDHYDIEGCQDRGHLPLAKNPERGELV